MTQQEKEEVFAKLAAKTGQVWVSRDIWDWLTAEAKPSDHAWENLLGIKVFLDESLPAGSAVTAEPSGWPKRFCDWSSWELTTWDACGNAAEPLG